jgi:hypothetical protein
MKLNKNMEFYTEYEGTNYAVYFDRTVQDGKYCLIDVNTKEVIKKANKPEKLDKFVYNN